MRMRENKYDVLKNRGNVNSNDFLKESQKKIKGSGVRLLKMCWETTESGLGRQETEPEKIRR